MPRNFGDEQWLNTDDRKGAVQAKIGAAGLIHVPKRKKKLIGEKTVRGSIADRV